MNIKQSLEDNKAEILKNLPEEFHADFLKSMQDAPTESAAPTPIAEVQKEVEAALPDDLKAHAADLTEVTDTPDKGATPQEEKAEILKALPDDLKAEFEKNWQKDEQAES